jgi:Ca-activated chloride channel homolog
MKFGALDFLWLFALIPLIVAFYIWAFKRKAFLLNNFVSSELRDRLVTGFSPRQQKLKVSMLLLSVAFVIFALIRPKYGFHWEEVKRRGVDILIALDVSESMLAEDVSPNRLERAKREIIDLLNITEGDRVGLVAFAGTSFLQCPLTLDYGAVQIFLDELSTDLIPVPGTAIGEAITKSVGAYDEKDRNSRVLILITDGEDHYGKPLEAAKKAAESGLKIYAIGIGQEGGAPIPDKKSGGFKKDRKGDVVMSQLDEDTLQKIALETGGSYVRSVTGNLDLENIYKDIRANVEDKELESGRRKRFEERYQWPLSLAIFLLFLEGITGDAKRRRREKSKGKGAVALTGSKLALFALSLLLFPVATRTQAQVFSTPKRDGEQAYSLGKYDEALERLLDAQIENPEDQNLKYNLGNTYYKMGEYDKAAQIFQNIAQTGPKDLADRSRYNLGNTAFRQGKLQEALTHYQDALAQAPDDEDAKYNLDYVRKEIKRRMEEQKKRQEEQQNQPQEGQENQDQQGENQKQQNQDGQQNQDQEGQKPQDQDGQKGQDEQQKEDEQQDGQPPQGEGENQEQQQEQALEQEKEGGGGRLEEQASEGEMSEQEAQRWLSTLKGDRKEYLKKKLKGQRTYQVEKDW